MVELTRRALVRWARTSNDEALRNARVGALECSRRAVERAEVEVYLHQHADGATPRAPYAVAR